MSRIVLITGKRQSGKTHMANEISKQYNNPLVLSGFETEDEIQEALDTKKPDLIIVELSEHHEKTYCFVDIDTIFTYDIGQFNLIRLDTTYATETVFISLEGQWVYNGKKWIKKT